METTEQINCTEKFIEQLREKSKGNSISEMEYNSIMIEINDAMMETRNTYQELERKSHQLASTIVLK